MSEETMAKAQAQPVGDPIKSSVLKSSAVMALGTLVSRVLGFVRWSLLIAAIGGLAANDAFQIANNLPNTVYNLLAAGVLDAILVPQIVRAFKSSSGSDYVNRLITLAGTILFGMTLLTLVGASVLVNIFAVEMSPGWKSLAIVFSLWCLPQIFFYGLYNLLGETLNARGIFGPYTWVPVVNNIIGIVGLIVFIWVYGGATNVDDPAIWTFERTALLAGPATLGVVVQALLLIIPLRKAGIRIRPDFKFRGAGLRSASKIAGWMFAVLLVNQLSIISTTNIAAAANNWREITGQYAPSITAVNFTFMIYMMPQSIIATSIAIAVFTRIASAVADNDLPQVSQDFHFGVRVTTVLNLWAAAILGAGAIPIFQALAPGTGEEQVYGTALALVVMLPGLGVAAISMFAHRVFFALEDGKPILLSVLAPTVAFVVTSWVLKAFLPGYLWVTGALAAEAAMRLGVAWLSLRFVAARIPGVRKAVIASETAVYFVIALLAGLVAYGLLWLVNPYAPGASYSVQLFGAAWRGIVVVLAVTVVYVLLMAVFDRRSFDAVLQAVGNRIPRVKQFGEKLPQVDLFKSSDVEPVPTEAADFFAAGPNPLQPVWFSEKLASSSGFVADEVASEAASKPAEAAPTWFEKLFEQLYKLAVVFQPAPLKHADPVAAPAADKTSGQPSGRATAAVTDTAVAKVSEFGTASEFGAAAEFASSGEPDLSNEFGAAAEFMPASAHLDIDLEETQVIGHLRPLPARSHLAPPAQESHADLHRPQPKEPLHEPQGDQHSEHRSHPLVIRRPSRPVHPEVAAPPAASSAAKRASQQVSALTSYITPALSKLKNSASSALKSDRTGKNAAEASSEISFKNGIMVETLHRGTRVISQSLESARQTVDDFQAGKRVDPTKPTIVIFALATLFALLLALATLGLLPSGGSHLDKGADTPTSSVTATAPPNLTNHLAKK
ncbi:MAG: lipid II flippase MurJ [Actinomycetaceae bacterium]|nr:lipid II flippase MurJ [Actinomycetaceae bacterium]